MPELGRGLPEWANYLLKVLFVLIFPLRINCSDISQILLLPTSGFLFTPVSNVIIALTDFSSVFSILGVYLRNFILGCVIAFPGVFYSYKLARAPLSKSYWIRGVGFSAAIYFIALGMLINLMQSGFQLIGVFNEDFWNLYNNLLLYPTLVFGVFIVLPLVLRQATRISVPPELHYYSARDIELESKFNLTREKLLSTIFWLFLCFAPYIIQLDYYDWLGRYYYSSFMMDYGLGIYSMVLPELYTSYLGCTVTIFGNIPFAAFFLTFHFAFVRDVYRYLRKSITQQRLIAMAVFSSYFPILISMSSGGLLYIFGFSIALPIPIPIIQIIGLLMVRYHHPQTIQSERVWQGDRSFMWWETERKEVPIQITPEKPIRQRDEVITIPVDYLLVSKVRKLLSRK
ncbi:hypothetical protein EU528_02670 [Candidatus Thorarchaeota archaeon]|nr:MAG: hypothetical protein EU528_02670 [Candidatus Thorarchaeota archaeon]